MAILPLDPSYLSQFTGNQNPQTAASQASRFLTYKTFTIDQVRQCYDSHEVNVNSNGNYVILPNPKEEAGEGTTALEISPTLPVTRNGDIIDITTAVPDPDNIIAHTLGVTFDGNIFARLGHIRDSFNNGRPQGSNHTKLIIDALTTSDAIQIIVQHHGAPSWAGNPMPTLPSQHIPPSGVILQERQHAGINAYIDYYLVRDDDFVNSIRATFLPLIDRRIRSLS